jgi:H+/Cl- antiporter ClcA
MNKLILKLINTYSYKVYSTTIETNAKLKKQFLEYLPFIIASTLTGLVSYFYSQLFFFSEKLSHLIFNLNNLYIFITTPICFVTSWWLVRNYAPYAKGSGIPQVMASIELAKPKSNFMIIHFLSFKIIVIKIISSAIKVIGGGILGREGPTIQISSSIFNQVYKYLPKNWTTISHQNILIAGAASGLAAAFNTPLGGIIFAMEELSKFHINHYKSTLFMAVIIAGLTAQGLGGSYLYLGYPNTKFDGLIVFLGVLIVSIFAGYFGSKLCSLLIQFISFINSISSKTKQLTMVLFCSLIIAGSIFLFGTEAMGSGKEIMDRTLFTENKNVEWYLPFLRMFGLFFSFGFGGAGGIFAPSLSTGASLGALIAQILQLTGSNANLLILIGMTAFLTGVTRAPFTSSIIIFEMTDRHSIIFFLFIGAIIANVIANFVSKKSFYDHQKEVYLDEVNFKNVL